MPGVGFCLLLPVIKQVLNKIKKQKPGEMARRKHLIQ